MTHYLLKVIHHGRGKGRTSTLTRFEDGQKTWQKSGPNAVKLYNRFKSDGASVKRIEVTPDSRVEFAAAAAAAVPAFRGTI